MKKSIALVLAVCLFIGSPFMAFAAKPEVTGRPADVITPLYLNLGDSIAYGMSAEPGKSYFDLFADYLKVGPSMNLGVPGATTGDLLMALNTKEYQRAVQRADIITISIGGNNLLRPVILAAFDAYGLDYNDYPNTEAALSALYEAIALAESVSSGHWNNVMAGLLASAQETNQGSLGYYLQAGALAFGRDWEDIIGSIRGMNPNATTIALNLYNPVDSPKNLPLSLEDALFLLFDDIFVSLNEIQQYYQGVYNYHVVDVYSAFESESTAVGFSVNPASLNLDPHPTTMGHRIIFDLLQPYAEMRAFQPGKPEGVGKALDLAVEELQMNNTEGLPAAHEVTGAVFGELVSETAQENPGILADHTSGNAAGLPAAHKDEAGEPLSGYAFGQAVSAQVREDVDALVEHVRGRKSD